MYGVVPGDVLKEYLANGVGTAASLCHCNLRIENAPNLQTVVTECSRRLVEHVRTVDVLHGIRRPDDYNMGIVFDVPRGGRLIRLLSPEPGRGIYFGGLLVDAAIAAARLSNLEPRKERWGVTIAKGTDLTKTQLAVLKSMHYREVHGATDAFWTERSISNVCVSCDTKSIFYAPPAFGANLPDAKIRGGLLANEHGCGRKRIIYQLIHLTASCATAWTREAPVSSTYLRTAQTIIVTDQPVQWALESSKYGVHCLIGELSTNNVQDGHVVSVLTPSQMYDNKKLLKNAHVWRIVYDVISYDEHRVRCRHAWLVNHNVDQDDFEVFVKTVFSDCGEGIISAYSDDPQKYEAWYMIVRQGLTVVLPTDDAPMEITSCMVEVVDPSLSNKVCCDDASVMMELCTGIALPCRQHNDISSSGPSFFLMSLPDSMCPVCRCIIVNAHRPEGCAHVACFRCLEQWDTSHGCVLCRQPYDKLVCESLAAPVPTQTFHKLNKLIEDAKAIKGSLFILTNKYETADYVEEHLPKHITCLPLWSFMSNLYPACTEEHVTLILSDGIVHDDFFQKKLVRRFCRFGSKTKITVLTYVVKDTQESDAVRVQEIT